MAGSLEEIGGQPGGDAVRRFLQVDHADDGTQANDVIAAPTYSASITPDASAGGWQTITVTDNAAIAVNAPTNPPAANRSHLLVIEVANASGGVMGTITWNAAFVLAGVTWTKPANGKSRYLAFRWNGTKWICVGAAAGDY